MTTPLLEAVDLSKYFPVKAGALAPRQLARAVDGVSFRLAPGETLGLAGESGCGKSTVARLLLGLIPPTGGEVRFEGAPLHAMGKGGMNTFRRNVQMIFQDPFSSLNPRQRVGDIIGEPMAIHGIATGTRRQEMVLDLMARVGLTEEQYQRYPHEFSGGQRQRIGIARALAVSPRLIVADEPVSALDLSIQAQILNLLLELKREYALSFLFIAHDLSVVRHMSDRIAVMYLGHIVEIGERDAVFDHYLHPYTEALLAAVPRITPADRAASTILRGDIPSPLSPPVGCPLHPRCPYARDLCRREVPPLEEKSTGHLAACHFSREIYSSAELSIDN